MSIAEHVNGLQHLGLPTGALDATVAFYESLGFTVALSTINPNTGERVCFLTCKGLCIETYECAEPAGRAGAIDHLALDVDDVEAAWEAVRAAGYTPWRTTSSSSPSGRTGCASSTFWGQTGKRWSSARNCNLLRRFSQFSFFHFVQNWRICPALLQTMPAIYYNVYML